MEAWKGYFGQALDLARYISSRDLSGVETVAFIPRTVKGHAVLVAMACEEIVMAPDAGHVKEAANYAERLRLPLGFVDKRRISDTVTRSP